MNFEKTINYLVADLTTIHRNLLEKSLNGIDLHGGQVFILFELWKKDGLSQIDLAKNLSLTPPTINKMVKSLSVSDFVSLTRGEKDSRIVRVYLTEKGNSIRSSVETVWQELEVLVLDNLTETEKLIFFQLLEKILSNFYGENIEE